MIALLTTTDPIKLSAIQALLEGGGVKSAVFDRAAGTLWTAIIPLRLMIADDDETQARIILVDAYWAAADDGEWDLIKP